MNEILLIVYFFALVLSKIEDAKGRSFLEEFKYFEIDPTTWDIDHNYLHCVGHQEGSTITGQCVYHDRSNVARINLDKAKPPRAEMHIVLENNCKGIKCCQKNICTEFTAGHVSSVATYAYGTFRFLVHPVASRGFMNDQSHEAFVCVGLERHKNRREDGGMSITFCLRANYREALMMWQYSEEITSRIIPIPYNAGKGAHLYRIDWSPSAIKWYMDGVFLTAADFDIPDEPLHIKMFLLPRRKNTKDISKELLGVKMEVLRVRYRKFDVDKVELFVTTEHSTTFKFVFFVLLIIGIACMSLTFHFRTHLLSYINCIHQIGKLDSNSHYSLLKERHHGLNCIL